MVNTKQLFAFAGVVDHQAIGSWLEDYRDGARWIFHFSVSIGNRAAFLVLASAAESGGPVIGEVPMKMKMSATSAGPSNTWSLSLSYGAL